MVSVCHFLEAALVEQRWPPCISLIFRSLSDIAMFSISAVPHRVRPSQRVTRKQGKF
jgi:hypothetical protein